MEGTNINYIQDGNTAHDYTYYGNGCPDLWSGSGSSVACSSNTETTIDGETQEIGVYYDFQAASAGTGSSIGTANANTPDTFCPLGWQLPYDGSGGDYYDKSRSVTYLFNTYTITADPQGSIKARSYPMSMIATGMYFWQNGQLYNQGVSGGFWTSTNENSNRAWLISIAITSVDPKNTDGNKVAGYALRCVFHRRHGGRNPCRFDSVY